MSLNKSNEEQARTHRRFPAVSKTNTALMHSTAIWRR